MNKINFEEIKKLTAAIDRAKRDPLVAFVSSDYVDALAKMRTKNLQNLFSLARKYQVRYIYVDVDEICGCERKDQPGSCWPAMWAIAREIGFPGSAGNSDQYQCIDANIAFPEDSYGAWDLETNTKLSDEDAARMGFYHVQLLFGRR